MHERRTTRAIACAIALGAMGLAGHAAAQAKLPPPVAADLKDATTLCSDAGGKPNAASAVKTVDLDADGKDDFVFYWGSIECDGAASIYGDREKTVTVYKGDGAGGAVAAFNDRVFDAKLEGAKLWLTTSGAGCGKPPAADFASESFCERPLVWDAQAKKFVYAPVSSVRMIE
jgi:hypothetical protein